VKRFSRAEKFNRIIVVSLSLLFFCYPKTSKAVGVDFLGQVADPVIGAAKGKVKGLMRYLWLQPYGGYASGTSTQERTNSNGSVTSVSDLKVEGIMYGARGGILLGPLKLGLDISTQSAKRNTLVESTTTSGVYSQKPVEGKNSMTGFSIGIDVPYTPLQGMYTRYVNANLEGDGASSGNGWGAGVSFILKNPFILMLESRQLSYSSATSDTGKKAEASVRQFYVGLSFMLL